MKDSRSAWRTAGISVLVSVVALAGCMLFQPKAVVDFDATPLSGMTPHRVDFTPIVEQAVATYEWDFGDGNTSTEPAPSHIYRVAGTFTVSLSVEFADGQAVEVVKENLVDVTLAAPKLPPAGPLVWLNRNQGRIYSGPRNGGEITTIVSGLQWPDHIAVADDTVYWTADWYVERVKLDGTGRETIFHRWDMPAMAGIAVDPVGGKVYWAYKGSREHGTKIWRSNLDGSGAAIWVSRREWVCGSYGPLLLAVDPEERRLYWYEMYQSCEGTPVPISLSVTPYIERNECSVHWSPLSHFADNELTAGLALRESEALALDLGLPGGAKYVYWTDPQGDAIWRSYVESFSFVPVVSLHLVTESPKALVVDAYEGKIYWSSSDGIHRANLSDGSGEELIYPGVHADVLALDL
jgi:PKD repeat protein